MARPDTLTDDVVTGLIRAFRRGLPPVLAARLVGVSPAALDAALAQGDDDVDEGRATRAAQVALALRGAEAEHAAAAFDAIEAATADDWKAAAWLLERRHGMTPAKGAAPPPVTPDGVPPADLSGLSLDDLDALCLDPDPLDAFDPPPPPRSPPRGAPR